MNVNRKTRIFLVSSKLHYYETNKINAYINGSGRECIFYSFNISIYSKVVIIFIILLLRLHFATVKKKKKKQIILLFVICEI